MSWGLGLVPEQAWEDPDTPPSPYGADPATASIGFINGKAAGSATPLIWAQAQYLRLVRDLQAGALLDQPSITRTRYVLSGAPAELPLSISSPAAGAIVPAATTQVSGTTSPGARVQIAAGQRVCHHATSVAGTRADSQGRFQATVPTLPG